MNNFKSYSIIILVLQCSNALTVLAQEQNASMANYQSSMAQAQSSMIAMETAGKGINSSRTITENSIFKADQDFLFSNDEDSKILEKGTLTKSNKFKESFFSHCEFYRPQLVNDKKETMTANGVVTIKKGTPLKVSNIGVYSFTLTGKALVGDKESEINLSVSCNEGLASMFSVSHSWGDNNILYQLHNYFSLLGSTNQPEPNKNTLGVSAQSEKTNQTGSTVSENITTNSGTISNVAR